MRKFSCFTLVSALVLFGALCYGETNSGTNAAKAPTGDLYTNDVHITKMEGQSVTLVYEVPLTKKQIYDKIIQWIAVSFKDSKSVIQTQDPEQGKIIGKGITDMEMPGLFAKTTSPCRFTMVIDIKDKKFRVQYSGFIFIMKTGGERGIYSDEPVMYEAKKAMIIQARELYDSLTAAKDDKDF